LTLRQATEAVIEAFRGRDHSEHPPVGTRESPLRTSKFSRTAWALLADDLQPRPREDQPGHKSLQLPAAEQE
jgi:hypothetical protein